MAREKEVEILSPHRRINRARRTLVDTSEDVRQVILEWASDPNRAATDISVNKLMEAHILIATTISTLNGAQSHTEKEE